MYDLRRTLRYFAVARVSDNDIHATKHDCRLTCGHGHCVLISDTSGNETVTAEHLLLFLEKNGFSLFTDLWAENELYFGKRGNEVKSDSH